MLQSLIKAITGSALALAMLVPAPVMAQEDTVVDDAELYYETTTDDDSLLYQTTDYEWETVSDDYETVELTDEQAAALGSFFVFLTGVGLVVFGVFTVVIYVYSSLTLMTIANKVGESPAWYAWVPFLNLYLMTKVAQIHPASLLLAFIPIVNFVYFVFVMMKVAERRGFPNWLGLLFLVPVVNLVLPGYLAWAEPSK